ncbi:hypothetical protein JW766_01745 [Candidatus Dojkabacteria bacterium]|nr:hypothetical protein [Candidatus Dojkabacteria bacterium]
MVIQEIGCEVLKTDVPYSVKLDSNPGYLGESMLTLTGEKGGLITFPLDMSPNFEVNFDGRDIDVVLHPQVASFCTGYNTTDPEVIGKMLGWFRTGIGDSRFVLTHQPVSHITRVVLALDAENPSTLLHFGGIGAGWADYNARRLLFLAPNFDPQTDVSFFYDLMNNGRGNDEGWGMTLRVLPHGKKQTTRSRSPVGAYTLKGLTEKARATRRRVERPIPGICFPEYVLLGEYTGVSWRERVGFSVYRTPVNLHSYTIAEISMFVARNYPEFYPSPEFLFGLFAFYSAHALGQLHRRGLVHNQYHDGNRGLAVDGTNRMVVRDLSTMQNITGHDNLRILKDPGDMTARQAALSYDLFMGLRKDLEAYLFGPANETLSIIGSYRVFLERYHLAEDLMRQLVTVAAWEIIGYESASGEIPDIGMIKAKALELETALRRYTDLWDSRLFSNNQSFYIASLATALATKTIRELYPTDQKRLAKNGRSKRRKR